MIGNYSRNIFVLVNTENICHDNRPNKWMNDVSADLVNHIDTKMPAKAIKIAVVGPLAVRIPLDLITSNFFVLQSGKSSFINLATETRETLTENYIPTVPVR